MATQLQYKFYQRPDPSAPGGVFIEPLATTNTPYGSSEVDAATFRAWASKMGQNYINAAYGGSPDILAAINKVQAGQDTVLSNYYDDNGVLKTESAVNTTPEQ